MTLELTPRARLLLVVALVLALAGAAMMAYTRLHKADDSSSVSVQPAPHASKPQPVAPRSASPKAAAPKQRAATHPAVKPKATPRPKATAPAPSPVDQLPAAVRRALAADRIVVVALYDPKAKIDGTALREARAGARLAGSSFVPIDVRKKAVDSLNAKYGVVQDPALLVLRPPGDLVVRIDGFADRDTVAQAAVDAASS